MQRWGLIVGRGEEGRMAWEGGEEWNVRDTR